MSGAILVASEQAAEASQADFSITNVIPSKTAATPNVTSLGSMTTPNINAPAVATTQTNALQSGLNPAAPSQPTAKDFRVRISPVNATLFYGTSTGNGTVTATAGTASSNINSNSTAAAQNSILAPLVATNGVLFPYSPTVQFEQTVNYTEAGNGMVHTNTDYYAYKNTPAITVNIVGKFTCQNQVEGLYALAVIHFFRTASKMYFGTKAGVNAGLPPPMLLLNGYGTYMYNNLNCILRSHSWSYNEQMDTVQVSTNGGYIRMPAMFDLNVSLTVQITPQKMRDEFDLNAFRTGQLMLGGGWI